MAERYQAKCRVCGKNDTIGPGWCKLLLYDDDYNKTTEWLCPEHYQEFVDSGAEVIPSPMKKKGGGKSSARRKGAKESSSGSEL